MLLLVLGLVPYASAAGYRDEVLTDNPAAYWRLGETSGTAAVSEVGGNTGTYAGGVTLSQPGALPGDPGNTAATFDGVNDVVTVPASATLDAASGVTVEAWVKRAKSGWQVLVGKPGNGQSRFENYALWIDSANRLQAYFGNGQSSFVVVAWATALDTNWHHVAATYDNATARLYVDGVQRGTASSTVRMATNGNPLNMGRANTAAYWFGGTLDEVAVYRTVLSATRIQAHFAAAAAPTVDGTPPAIGLAQPANGSVTEDPTPTFAGVAGTAAGDLTAVTVRVYAGASATGTPVQTLTTTRGTGGAYTVDASSDLANGVYTARAEQSDGAGNVGQSTPTTFTVAVGSDVTPPAVTLTQPANGSQSANTTPTFSGAAGTAIGDSATITVRVYAGTAATGTPVRTLATTRALSGYSVVATPALVDGIYTARAEQSDATGNVGLSAAATFTIDTSAPVVTVTAPAQGTTLTTATPTVAGAAGAAAGDGAAVTVRVYAGTAATGTPVQTLAADRQGTAAYSVTAASLPNGTYTVRATQADAAGNTGTSSAVTFTVAVAATDPVVVAAGDIAGCGTTPKDAETAALVGQHPTATVLTLGDAAYDNGTATEYANCFGPTWGLHKSRTRPIVSDHDLDTGNPSGYLGYFQQQLAPFGSTATDPTKMYYSYNLGTWHVVALNAVCFYYTPGCDPAAQAAWMRADMAANPNQCTLVLMHAPRWSSGAIHGSNPDMQAYWSAAYDLGAELVLSGDDHVYERFAPMDAAGNADAAYGVRQFVVGTGGYLMYGFGTPRPNSVVRYNAEFGVIKLTLRSGGYDWQYIPINGAPSPDSGSANCHTPPPPAGSGVPGAPQVRASATAQVPYPSTAITFARPAGTVAGDVLLATVSHQGGSIRTLTPPAGWSAVPGADATDGSNVRTRAFVRVAGSAEPASYVFTLTGGSGMSMAGGVMAISGASTTVPINAAGGQPQSTNTTSLTAPSVTTTVGSTLLVYAGGVNSPVSSTPPAGMQEHWDVATNTQYNVSATTAAGGFAGPGATGTRTATLSQNSRGAALLIAVAPGG